MIEKRYDIPFVASLALREKQIQQSYRPIIAVHKWFARRPGSLFRSLLLSEFVSDDLREAFFNSNDLRGIKSADPFMGGGTPLFEANRVGCDVIGCDVNPMAYWVVKQELSSLDVDQYLKAAWALRQSLAERVGEYYQTRCRICGELADTKYYLWAKTLSCPECNEEYPLLPGYQIASRGRHPAHVLLCWRCGHLNETGSLESVGRCEICHAMLRLEGNASRGVATCPHCGAESTYPQPEIGPPQHQMIAIEYHCARCKPSHSGRFFKSPDGGDLETYRQTTQILGQKPQAFAPREAIPPGDETTRLLRWGYRQYRDMFNARQLLALDSLCDLVSRIAETEIRHALATNVSDLVRYQNMLCRYDKRALKSLDIFSVHGFPVGLIQCESNVLGIVAGPRKTPVGSGGLANFVTKYASAKRYCQRPFEKHATGTRARRVYQHGEWIGEGQDESEGRSIDIRCASATDLKLSPNTLDIVLTDPPYFANVQYAELMDFLYVWLRRLVSDDDPAFSGSTTRSSADLTGNETSQRGLDHFTAGLATVFTRMKLALKPGRPLVFTYHHNQVEGYVPVVIALLDAGMVCTASLPCPAEMAGSIHINGTGSSVLDSVLVCRETGTIKKNTLFRTREGLIHLVSHDLRALQEGGLEPSQGDTRCVTLGHLARMAVWSLRSAWDVSASFESKQRTATTEMLRFGDCASLLQALGVTAMEPTRRIVAEGEPLYDGDAEISF